MTELAVTLLRLGYLLLLWIFVMSVMGVLRRDIFGTRVAARAPGARKRATRSKPARPPAGRTRPGRLVVTAGPLSGTTLPLGEASIVAGRSPACTLVLDDDYASGRHARFFPREGQWWVEDLGSTNGTLVGEQRITSPVPLAVGAPVRIGHTVIELRR